METLKNGRVKNEDDKIEYYIVEFSFDKDSFFAFWYSDETDKFYTNKNKIVILRDYEEMLQYAEENSMLLSNEHTVIECEYILNWKIELDIIAEDMLDFWNISHDLAHSIGEIFIGDSSLVNNVYDKLFQSCKESMLILEKSVNVTEWNIEEKVILLKVIQDGIRILKEGILH